MWRVFASSLSDLRARGTHGTEVDLRFGRGGTKIVVAEKGARAVGFSGAVYAQEKYRVPFHRKTMTPRLSRVHWQGKHFMFCPTALFSCPWFTPRALFQIGPPLGGMVAVLHESGAKRRNF